MSLHFQIGTHLLQLGWEFQASKYIVYLCFDRDSNPYFVIMSTVTYPLHKTSPIDVTCALLFQVNDVYHVVFFIHARRYINAVEDQASITCAITYAN